MKNNKTLHSFKTGFTLVELLTVIAIIGILAAILIPVTTTAMEQARRLVTAKNLSSIASSYMTYTSEGGTRKFMNAANAHDFARILAQYTDLNHPDVWIQRNDPLVEEEMAKTDFPVIIAHPGSTPGAKWETDSDFKSYPLSVAVANRLSSRANSRTPIAWTRGLKSNGSWTPLDAPNPSPNGDDGGHVCYLDGHVEWHETLSEGKGVLIHATAKKPTANIQHAIGPRTEILESN